MILTRIRVQGFRCHEDVTLEGMERLAVVVGENDVGKTSLLDAICIALGEKGCSPTDFLETGPEQRVDRAVFEAEFRLEAVDVDLPERFRSGAKKDRLMYVRTFLQAGGEQTEVDGLGYEDDRFDDANFDVAENQKEALRAYDVEPARLKTDRFPQRDQLVKEGRLRLVERKVPLTNFKAELMPFLPRIERISATEYANPSGVVQRTLQAVARTVVRPIDPATGKEKEREDLKKVKNEISVALDAEIETALTTLRRLFPDMAGLRVEPHIDFAKAVGATDLVVETPQGPRSLSMFGAGRNRKMWMGLLHWEREVAQRRGRAAGSVLRLYDEPDVALDYGAQRDLFSTIHEWAHDPDAKTQCIVCTHAVTMIDRAPIAAVRLVRSDGTGRRQVERLTAPDADAQTRMLHEIGRAVGLTNSVLLYERAFLVFEGESEREAVPILYRTLFGTTLADDGIVAVALEGCGAWKSALEVLFRNRLPLVHLLLDADTRTQATNSNVSEHTVREVLGSLGQTAEQADAFFADQITFVGAVEFEDAFGDDVITRALESEFPRADGRAWTPEDVRAVRAIGPKFSTELGDAVFAACERQRKNSARKKPAMAGAVARSCLGRGCMPETVVSALETVRKRAGVA
jgi:putative ATP-dependent endonuclease of OLD family